MTRARLAALILGSMTTILLFHSFLSAVSATAWWWLAISGLGAVLVGLGMRIAALLSRLWAGVGSGIGVAIGFAVFVFPSGLESSAWMRVMLVFSIVAILMRLIPDTVFTQPLRGLHNAHQERPSNGADAS